MPACNECRRRKLRCSRELPSCKECRRLGASCQYEVRDTKPGMKSGAVENLNRRVDHLENLIRNIQSQSNPATWNGDTDITVNGQRHSRTASDLLESFERELRKFNSGIHQSPRRDSHRETDGTHPSASSTSPSLHHGEDGTQSSQPHGRKRRRLDPIEKPSWGRRIFHYDSDLAYQTITPEELLESVIDSYFIQVHPWIPMIHQARFRRRMDKDLHGDSLEVILHAMVVAAIKFVELTDEDDLDRLSQVANRSRDFVILHSMDSLSVENLQALIIIAFDDIGRGNSNKAWSIIGSLTRTVEYLQLSIESEKVDEIPLLQPCPSLALPDSWIEVEEQRRVFWNIFNLDRFCSIVTGWNTSLTSDDVYRCLPADGLLWRQGEPVSTPYFGIWDKSAGRIGNSIAFLPSQYSSPTQTADNVSHSPLANSVPEGNIETAAISTIGAFAYCIEATESMSRVTTYFLQQKINLRDHKQIESWLTRFKELDLRLVHWKMFLPQKWKDAKIQSQKASEILMDQNLTLAHVTHNASMILLHQLIAYPHLDWSWATRLPSQCSADTCQEAAVEIATITQHFLGSATKTKTVNNQFVFCVFVAARSLLIHWRYYSDQAPLPEFELLVASLEIMSTRWQGCLKATSRQTDLAAKYATRLRSLHENCNTNPSFRIDVLGYANDSEQNLRTVSKNLHPSGDRSLHLSREPQNYKEIAIAPQILPSPLQPQQKSSSLGEPVPNFVSVPDSRQYIYNQVPLHPNGGGTITDIYSTPQASLVGSNGTVINEYDLDSISQMFFDQQYMEMDRIISFDDGMFTANMGFDERIV